MDGEIVCTKKVPRVLKALSELPLVQSAESSNRIEGVTVVPARLRPFVLGNAWARERSEEEILGYRRALDQERIPPLLTIACLVLDFPCIHPFQDGNGRVSRLLTLLALYQHGYEVGRYISLERLVEESREEYYEVLRRSSEHWHDGRHDLLPWVNYFLMILRRPYGEFVERVGQVRTPRGAKLVWMVRRSRCGFGVATAAWSQSGAPKESPSTGRGQAHPPPQGVGDPSGSRCVAWFRTLFFGPAGVTPDSREAIFGHAGNGEVVCGEIGNQATQMDALGHFGFINQPGETTTYFGGLTQSEVVGPSGLKRLGIDKAEPIVTSVRCDKLYLGIAAVSCLFRRRAVER